MFVSGERNGVGGNAAGQQNGQKHESQAAHRLAYYFGGNLGFHAAIIAHERGRALIETTKTPSVKSMEGRRHGEVKTGETVRWGVGETGAVITEQLPKAKG